MGSMTWANPQNMRSEKAKHKRDRPLITLVCKGTTVCGDGGQTSGSVE